MKNTVRLSRLINLLLFSDQISIISGTGDQLYVGMAAETPNMLLKTNVTGISLGQVNFRPCLKIVIQWASEKDEKLYTEYLNFKAQASNEEQFSDYEDSDDRVPF